MNSIISVEVQAESSDRDSLRCKRDSKQKQCNILGAIYDKFTDRNGPTLWTEANGTRFV